MKKFSRDEFSFIAGATVKGYYALIDSKTRAARDLKLRPLGGGGSSVVFLAKQQLQSNVAITRAIKFYLCRDDVADMTRHKYTGPVSTDEFIHEVANISQFNHENLLKVIDAGLYKWRNLQIPFLVTELVEGPTLADLQNPKKAAHPAQCQSLLTRLHGAPEIILDLLYQIGVGLLHLHQNNFVHCDIAPKNIFIQPGMIKPIIGDLGTGKSLDLKTRKVFVCGTQRYMPPEVNKYRYKDVDWKTFISLHPWWDLYSFIKTAQETLNLLSSSIKPSWRSPLQKSLQQAEQRIKFLTLESLIDRITWLNPVHRTTGQIPELSPSISSQHYKLMPVQSPMLSFRLKRLADHPALTRLAKTPQITSARHIFPGATHSRYEHSLGTMETVRKYLQALIDKSTFLEHLSPEGIETALVTGLLYSITRFPFSNIVHEVKSKEKHLLQDLSRTAIFAESMKVVNADGKTIKEEIATLFPYCKFDLLERIITGQSNSHIPDEIFIHSMLNCSLDARVIDFVRRDSLHLGLASESFSLEEILPYLTTDNHRLALSISGLSIAEEIICRRYWLFNRIYWSYPNRSFVSMFRHLFMELAVRPRFVQSFKHHAMRDAPDEILAFCLSQAKLRKRPDLEDLAFLLNQDLQPLYKTGFEFNKKENDELSITLAAVLKMDHDARVKLQGQIANRIQDVLVNPEKFAKVVPVIIDLPHEPGGLSKLGDDMNVIKHDGRATHLSAVSAIIAGVQNSFENVLLRMRVFIHPDLMPADEDSRERLYHLIGEFLKENVN